MASGRHRTTSSCTSAHVYLLIDENPIGLVRSVDDTAVRCWRTALPDATLCGTGQDRNQAAGSHAVASIGLSREPFIQRFDCFELGLVEDLRLEAHGTGRMPLAGNAKALNAQPVRTGLDRDGIGLQPQTSQSVRSSR